MPRKGLSCPNSTPMIARRHGALTPLALIRHRAVPCSAWPLEQARPEWQLPH